MVLVDGVDEIMIVANNEEIIMKFISYFALLLLHCIVPLLSQLPTYPDAHRSVGQPYRVDVSTLPSLPFAPITATCPNVRMSECQNVRTQSQTCKFGC